MAAEPYDTEALAAAALQQHAERKLRRSYQITETLMKGYF
jgi:hypothetical protein